MEISRRNFVKTTAAGTAAMLLNKVAMAQAANSAAGSGDEIKVGMIGVGKQGSVLYQDTVKVPGVRIEAVCDIWETFSLKIAKGRLRRHNREIRGYTDYQEMLEKETGLDAVIVATPDFMHAEHAIACLKAGKHVYCEKEMSNDLTKAADMVKASRETGKMLQIGHQRRSNPVYLHAQGLVGELCGKLTNLYGQWNRPVQKLLEPPERYPIDPAFLKKMGYDNMSEFLNWRWFKKYSAGPIADLGSHQIDIFEWFLHTMPSSVMAIGGVDYYPNLEWFEDVLCLYEYQTKHGSARAFYQVINTNGFGNYFEKYGGDKGTLILSETDKLCHYRAEPSNEAVPAWMQGVEASSFNGLPTIPFVKALANKDEKAKADMEAFESTNVHQFHLANFFGAVRKNDPKLLTCPAAVAYPTAVAVLNAIPAVESGKKIVFTPEQFKA